MSSRGLDVAVAEADLAGTAPAGEMPLVGNDGDPAVLWSTRLAAALAEGSDAATALADLCEEIRRMLPCDRVQIWRGDIRQMSMHTMIAVGFREEEATALRDLVIPLRDFSLLDERFLTEKIALVANADELSPGDAALLRAYGIHSALYLLLERGRRVIGALQLSWCSPGKACMPDPAIVELIRLHASLGVDFVARTDEALGLSQNMAETATLLARIHDPDELLQAMAAKVAEAVGCDWASVHLLENEAYEMRRVAIYGFADPPLEPSHSPEMLDWLQEQIAASAEGVLEVPDVAAVEQLSPHAHSVGISSYVAVPLADEGRLVGILTIGYRKRVGPFARRQISLAKGLAHHALVALRNARLVHSLQEANQVKADFIAAVSHDLRTPLHVLIGYNAMLLEGAAGALTEEQRALIVRMYDCSVRFLDLINGVLGLGRVEAGFDRVMVSQVSLTELCDDLLREIEYLRRPEVELRHDVQPVVVSSDEAKLATILRNLVTNALKFTTDGFVEIQLHVVAAQLVMRVCDSGPGIHPEERPKVFEMFRQGSAGLRAGGSGIGLGLYLVKRLSQMLGGTVELLSSTRGETVFEVRVPI